MNKTDKHLSSWSLFSNRSGYIRDILPKNPCLHTYEENKSARDYLEGVLIQIGWSEKAFQDGDVWPQASMVRKKSSWEDPEDRTFHPKGMVNAKALGQNELGLSKDQTQGHGALVN